MKSADGFVAADILRLAQRIIISAGSTTTIAPDDVAQAMDGFKPLSLQGYLSTPPAFGDFISTLTHANRLSEQLTRRKQLLEKKQVLRLYRRENWR